LRNFFKSSAQKKSQRKPAKKKLVKSVNSFKKLRRGSGFDSIGNTSQRGVYVNHLRELRRYRKLDRVKESYSNGHRTKLFLRNIYNNSISGAFLRNELFRSKFRRDMFVNVLIKPLYKLDILL
jgi:hypothetical protein